MVDTKLLTCGICEYSFTDIERKPMVLTCGHSLCKKCLDSSNMKKECPWCKVVFDKNKVLPNFQILTSIEEYRSKMNEAAKAVEEAKSAKAAKAAAEAAKAAAEADKAAAEAAIVEKKNLQIEKLTPFNYKCKNHPDIKVVNFCSNCEFFFCIECAYDCSQKNHTVKYINNRYLNMLKGIQTNVKDGHLYLAENGIKITSKKISDLTTSLNESTTVIDKSYEVLTTQIDKMIKSLEDTKQKILETKKIVKTGISGYLKELEKLNKDNFTSLIVNCYLNRSSCKSDSMKLIYDSLYDELKKLRLLSKLDNHFFVEEAKEESELFKKKCVEIAKEFNSEFDDLFFKINKFFEAYSKTELIKTLTVKLERTEITLSKEINESIKPNDFNKSFSIDYLNENTNLLVKRFSEKILSY